MFQKSREVRFRLGKTSTLISHEKLRRCNGLYHCFKAAICLILASNTSPTPPHAGGAAWGGLGGVFEARIKQIAALNLVLRPGIRIPGRKSPSLDVWGGVGGVLEARIKQIAALK